MCTYQPPSRPQNRLRPEERSSHARTSPHSIQSHFNDNTFKQIAISRNDTERGTRKSSYQSHCNSVALELDVKHSRRISYNSTDQVRNGRQTFVKVIIRSVLNDWRKPQRRQKTEQDNRESLHHRKAREQTPYIQSNGMENNKEEGSTK